MRARRFPLLLLAFAGGLFSHYSTAGECGAEADTRGLYSQGWGIDARNSRYQPQSSINRDNVAQLQLHWVFALDEGASPHSYPLVTRDTLFIGTDSGNVYALDKDSACQRWVFAAGAAIRTGISTGEVNTASGTAQALFFGTRDGFTYALDAATGEQLWRVDIKDHPFAMATGTPTYYRGELFVPVSSGELVLAINPFYGCCKFRGSLLSLDASSGEQQWRTHVIPDEPAVSGRHYIFVEEWGPSGAPVWSAPTVNAEGDLIYVGTGENYTAPASKTSDAIIAFDRKTGAIRWVQQYTENDTFNMACTVSLQHVNCPDNPGPDLDFGAPPILARTLKGEPILLAGQKSGGIHAMDPVTGDRLWSRTFGRGGYLGGVHWGIAVNERLGLVFVPISDIPTGLSDEPAAPGVNAVDIETGELRWFTPNGDHCEGKESCRTGMSAAILATQDLLFAAALDGKLHAYSATTGEILWSYDSWRDFDSVNGLPTRGGAIDVHGPMVAGDMLFIQSGYGSFGQRGGNALLAFKLGAQQ